MPQGTAQVVKVLIQLRYPFHSDLPRCDSLGIGRK
jgi:hypothetical protein